MAMGVSAEEERFGVEKGGKPFGSELRGEWIEQKNYIDDTRITQYGCCALFGCG